MSLSPSERKLLGQLADVLIPAGSGLPSASAAGVVHAWLDQVLSARPDLLEGLKSLLTHTRDRDAAIAVADLRASDPAAFGILAEITAGAYFMNPEVRQAIGYAGQTQHPIDPHPDYLDDGLLDSVKSRGPIYRPTPK